MKVVFHSLRHSCASQLLNSGADLPTIQAILGHKSIVMTQRYAHLTPGFLRQATAMLDNTFTEAKLQILENAPKQNATI